MNPRTALNLWRWPLAVVLGLASVAVAILAAGLGYRGLMAIPHWALSLFSGVMLTVGASTAIVAAMIRRRKTGDSASRRTGDTRR